MSNHAVTRLATSRNAQSSQHLEARISGELDLPLAFSFSVLKVSQV